MVTETSVPSLESTAPTSFEAVPLPLLQDILDEEVTLYEVKVPRSLFIQQCGWYTVAWDWWHEVLLCKTTHLLIYFISLSSLVSVHMPGYNFFYFCWGGGGHRTEEVIPLIPLYN